MITLARGLLVLAFFGAAAFVATYHLLAPWWRTDIGRNTMAFAASETGVLGMSVLGLWLGDFPGRALLGLVLFATFTGVSWWRWSVLIRAQAGSVRGHTASCACDVTSPSQRRSSQ